MAMDLEGMLDAAKQKIVDAATEKFGASATPIAEEVASKTEEVVAGKLGVNIHGSGTPGSGTSNG